MAKIDIKAWIIVILILAVAAIAGLYLIEREKTSQTHIRYKNPDRLEKRNVDTQVDKEYDEKGVLRKETIRTIDKSNISEKIDREGGKMCFAGVEYAPLEQLPGIYAGILLFNTLGIGAGVNTNLKIDVKVMILF